MRLTFVILQEIVRGDFGACRDAYFLLYSLVLTVSRSSLGFRSIFLFGITHGFGSKITKI